MIAGEILALLHLGCALGPHVRWRVLHEVAVIAWFLAAGDEEPARRYRRQSYGPIFKKRYGWSAQHFGHAPEFRKIEEAVDLGHLRSYYRMASHPIRAGPKGITFEI